MLHCIPYQSERGGKNYTAWVALERSSRNPGFRNLKPQGVGPNTPQRIRRQDADANTVDRFPSLDARPASKLEREIVFGRRLVVDWQMAVIDFQDHGGK